MIKKKPINIYWAPYTSVTRDGADWSFLYPSPNTLYVDLAKQKSEEKTFDSYFACPAFANKTKKIFTFYNPMNASYEFDFTQDLPLFKNTSEKYIAHDQDFRKPAINAGPIVELKISYIFFADEPLEAYFTPPMFHPAKYTKYASIIPGEFDIGQWFRPFNVEMQMWNQKGEFVLEENEPLFYVEFKTDRPINLKKFVLSDDLLYAARATVGTTQLFGSDRSLLNRYRRFKNVGMREKILTEISKNIIDKI